MQIAALSNQTDLAAMSYHRHMTDYLRQNEKAVWNWYAESKQQSAYCDAVRLDLLKSTYRLNRETHEKLYASADTAASKLALDIPLTFYQSQHDQPGANACICCLPGEAHIVLTGAVLETLNDAELLALIAHELGHYKMRVDGDGSFAIADRVLDAIAVDPRAEPSHVFSAMRFRQYAEIFSDRCSWQVCGNVNAVVACLVKVTTGLKTVDPVSYLAQADEIFSKSDVFTEGLTHPETFIRARALAKWASKDPDADAEIQRMIEGPLHTEQLDFLRQKRMTAATRTLVDAVLTPQWIRSEPVLAHARLLFHDYAPLFHPVSISELQPVLDGAHESVKDYLCYLLLDFAAVDPALDEVPLAHVLNLAEQLGLGQRLEELANRELRTTKKALARIRQEGTEMLAKAEHA